MSARTVPGPERAVEATQARAPVLARATPARLALAAVVAIAVLALGVRLYGLTSYGAWFDEAYHVQLVKLPNTGTMLDAVLSNPPSDPLYVLLLRPWTWLFGTQEAAIRLLSVLFSTATIPVTYWLGRVLSGTTAGLMGALLLALSPYGVELGQEAALYALASLTATAALAAGWHWRTSGLPIDGWLYVVLGVVAIYSHYVVAAILLLFALLCILPATGPAHVERRLWAGAHGLILLAWSPWLLAMLAHWLYSLLPRVSLGHTATAGEVAGAFAQYTVGTAALLGGRTPLEAVGVLCGGALLALGWLAGRVSERRGLRVVVVLSAVIFLVPAIVSAATGAWLFVPHFMLFLLPALFVTCGAGVGWAAAHTGALLKGRGWWAAARYAVPALLIIWLGAELWGLVLYYRYPPHGADGLREMAAVLHSDVKSSDMVATQPPILTPTLAQYYPGEIAGVPSDFDLRAVYQPFGGPAWLSASEARLAGLASSHSRLWLVYRPESDPGGALLGWVKSRYRLLSHSAYEYAQLYLFALR